MTQRINYTQQLKVHSCIHCFGQQLTTQRKVIGMNIRRDLASLSLLIAICYSIKSLIFAHINYHWVVSQLVFLWLTMSYSGMSLTLTLFTTILGHFLSQMLTGKIICLPNQLTPFSQFISLLLEKNQSQQLVCKNSNSFLEFLELQVDNLQEFSRFHKLPLTLQARLQNFFRQKYRGKFFDSEIFDSTARLPPSLKQVGTPITRLPF